MYRSRQIAQSGEVLTHHCAVVNLDQVAFLLLDVVFVVEEGSVVSSHALLEHHSNKHLMKSKLDDCVHAWLGQCRNVDCQTMLE